MAISMYQASAPVFDKMLGNLGTMLGKAATWAEGRKIEPAVLMNARLAPDMFALPNFYFHYTMVYAILRHNGLDLSKGDYIG